MKSKKIIAALALVSMLFSTVGSFAADRDFWKKSPEKLFATKKQMAQKKTLRATVSKTPKNYYFEANGHLFEMDYVNEAFAKNPEGFLADLKVEKAVKPVNEKFKVVSVSAITKFSVDVVFAKPLEEAVKDATLKVTDDKGAVVEVVAKDLVKGATVASFDFKKALTEDPKGKWIVEGIEKDLDLEKYIADFINAADQVALNKALNDLKIANVKAENSKSYLDAKPEFLTKNPNPTVEAIQKFVDEVNANASTAEDVKAIIQAAIDNKDVLLINLLKVGNFERVNEDWIISEYKAPIAALTPGTDTKKDIQDAINTANDAAAVAAEGAIVIGSEVEEALKVKSAIVNYHSEDVPPATTKAGLLKEIDKKVAVLKLKKAKTETAAYSALEDYKAIQTIDSFYPGLKEYYLAKANTVAGFVPLNVNAFITASHTDFVNAVKAPGNTQDQLLKLLKKYPAENVLDENKKQYHEQDTATDGTADFKQVADLAGVKKLVKDANEAVLKPDATKSGEDLQIEKTEYVVGEDFTITFTLRDANNKVLADINGNTDATVKVNATVVSLAKAEIVNGKVTVTGKFGADAVLHDLKVTLVDPAVVDVARTGVKIVVKAADKPVHFKVEKGGTKGVKFTALDINYKTMGSYGGTVRMADVVLKLEDGAGQYTQVVALDGLTLGSADVTFNGSGIADDKLNSMALADGNYQLTFTVDGVAHTLTFKKP